MPDEKTEKRILSKRMCSTHAGCVDIQTDSRWQLLSIMVVLKRIRLNIVDVQESVIVGETDEMDKDNSYFCSNKFAKDKRVISKFFITSQSKAFKVINRSPKLLPV